MRIAAWIFAASFISCAAPSLPDRGGDHRPDPTLEFPDLAAPPDLATVADLAMQPDLAPAASPDLAATTPTAAPDLGGASVACRVRINEVATGTTTSGYEEFVELYNPCASAISLAGWKLVYRSANGSADIVLIADLGMSLGPGGFAVFASGSYYSTVRQGTLGSGLAENGGGLALRDDKGVAVDSMGWGTATNAFVVGTAPAAPGDRAPPGRSLARSPDGQDSASNSADFQLTDMPTPGAPNVIH